MAFLFREIGGMGRTHRRTDGLTATLREGRRFHRVPI